MTFFQVLFCTQIIATQSRETGNRPRVIILTDISNEPDDEQSMVRYLCYANEFDTEALIATTSCWLRDRVAPEKIRERIVAYGKVHNNLIKHAQGYPTSESLMNLVTTGPMVFGMSAVGEGKSSPGSKRIITIVDKDDPRPVYISIWGGANTLAQALWEVRNTRSKADVKKFVSKLRVYTISDQDDTGPWMRREFPGLFYIVTPGFEENGGKGYHFATWVGISGDKFHGHFNGADFDLVSNSWLDKHIRKDHGPLGALHPQTEYLMEGDTPSFFWLIPTGLSDPEHPDYGSWGGRYELNTPKKEDYHYVAETRPIWTNADDQIVGIDGRIYKNNWATIFRWREAYQNDFAARMDWSIASKFEAANHNPLIVVNGIKGKIFVPLQAKSGETIDLNADGSTDPDGDQIEYTWFVYNEAGSCRQPVVINQAGQNCSFVAPPVTKRETIHIILQAKDNGIPPLYSYRRVIFTIVPKKSS